MTDTQTRDRDATVDLSRPYRRTEVREGVDLRLDANEGPRPGARVRELVGGLDPERLRRYPNTTALETALAARLGVDAAQVLVTAGADDAIDRCCRVALGGGGDLLLPAPSFEMFERYARLAGARVRRVPWPEGPFPVDAFEGGIDGDTRAIAVVSPNNPTGAIARTEDVRRLAARLDGGLVIVDAAYAEFADEDLTACALELPNVIALRTFSKAWGLAGLRVGYAIGPADQIARLRASGPPYAVAGPSLALAEAALADGDAFVQRTVAQVRRERKDLETELRRLGAQPLPSQANFVLARFADPARTHEDLQALGIAVRRWPDDPRLRECLRVGCPADANDFERLRDALRTALRPQALLFDMDGVIADEGPSYRESILRTARSWSVEIDRDDVIALKASGGANNDWEVTHRLLARAGVEVDYASVVARFEGFYQGRDGEPGLCEKEELIADRDLLVRLRDRIPLAIVTGRPRRDALRFLERFGLRELFGAVVTLDDAPAKPDPSPVRLALKSLGVHTAWMVGDTPDDARAARAAGVLPLGILPPAAVDAVGPDVLVAAGCARVLDSLEDLEELLP